MMKIEGIVKMDKERILQRVLCVIVALSAIAFLAFYLIDYDTPFIGNTAFSTPMLTDVLFWFMWGLSVVTTIASTVAVVRGIRRANRSEGMTNGIPARKIIYTTYGITVLILFSIFVLGSTQTMVVNGENFTDSSWLRITDMFVNSSLLLLVLAVGVIASGATRYYRKGREK